MLPVDELLDDVCSPDPKKVAAALQAAHGRGEELGPAIVARLSAVLADANADPRPKGDRPFIGFLLYLAAEFRLRAAHPLMARLLRLGEDRVHQLTGDVSAEAGGCILAETFASDPASLVGLIEDDAAGPFERGAGLHALAILVRRELLPRGEMLALMLKLAAALDPGSEPDHMVANLLVEIAVQLHVHEIRGTIMDLYERGLAEENFFESDFTGPALQPDTPDAREVAKLDRRIDHAWEAVQHWYFFSEDFARPRRSRGSTASDDPIVKSQDLAARPDFSPPPEPASPAVPYRAAPKIGRNAPCPCGSGKKFKKCCGR